MIYQLKVTLRGVDPPIWRRLVVDSASTLGHLHRVIQVAFAWEDYHLHVFESEGVEYGVPSTEDWRPVRDERRVLLHQLLAEPRDWLTYEYDFGDSWEHEVMLEQVLPVDADRVLPACIGGERAAPPEDSGGPYGYEDKLEALLDPAHPEHEDIREWMSPDWNPEAFDLASINARLSRVTRKRKRTS